MGAQTQPRSESYALRYDSWEVSWSVLEAAIQ